MAVGKARLPHHPHHCPASLRTHPPAFLSQVGADPLRHSRTRPLLRWGPWSSGPRCLWTPKAQAEPSATTRPPLLPCPLPADDTITRLSKPDPRHVAALPSTLPTVPQPLPPPPLIPNPRPSPSTQTSGFQSWLRIRRTTWGAFFKIDGQATPETPPGHHQCLSSPGAMMLSQDWAMSLTLTFSSSGPLFNLWGQNLTPAEPEGEGVRCGLDMSHLKRSQQCGRDSI